MSIQNKIAVGIAGVSGALAVGVDARAQVVVYPVTPGNYVTASPAGTASYGNSFTIGPHSSIGFSVTNTKTGSTIKSYLKQFTGNALSFAVSTASGKPEKYSYGSVISAALSATSKWQVAPVLFSTYTVPAASSSKNSIWAFRFISNSGIQDYGWIGIHQQADGVVGSTSVTGLAYTTNGASITAGTNYVPEPASASLLAMGAMALGARGVRRMKKAVAEAKQAA